MLGGIDEAGRGPVLGPLVVAGVALPDDGPLRAMGVRDSKRLSPAQRARMARLIPDLPGVRVAMEVAEPADIDGRRGVQNLNAIEAEMFGRVAARLGCDRLFLDAADVDAKRFGRRVGAALPGTCHVVSEHGADDRHPVVAAASIVAKVARDGAMDELGRRLERRLGLPLGSGYPGDARTMAFLTAYVDAHQDLPEGCRRTWSTARALLERVRTPRLDSF